MQLSIDPAELKVIVREVAAELERERATLDIAPERLAYSESEAADLLGLKPHVLRDERLRGRIGHTKIVGGRIRYRREDLLAYLAGGADR
jgi:hypothetical protein